MRPCICCRVLELCPPGMSSEGWALTVTKPGVCTLCTITLHAGVAEVEARSRGRRRRTASWPLKLQSEAYHLMSTITLRAGVAEVGALSRGRGRLPAPGQWPLGRAAGAGGGLSDRGHQWVHVLCSGEAAMQDLDRGMIAAETTGSLCSRLSLLFSMISLEHGGATQPQEVALWQVRSLAWPPSRHSHIIPCDFAWEQALPRAHTAPAVSAAKTHNRAALKVS